MNGFGVDEVRAFLAGVFAVAWADRELQDEERVLLRELVGAFDLDEETQKRVDSWYERPVAVTDVPWPDLTPAGRAFLYLHASKMAKADGRLTGEESQALSDLARLMDLPRELVHTVEATGQLDPDAIPA